MPVILQIDGSEYLVPDSVNVNTLLKAIDGFVKVDWDYNRPSNGRGDRFYIVGKKPIVEMRLVDKKFVIDPAKQKRLPASRQIPEVTSEHCNGDMGIR
jgi:hypothetical protein